MGKARNVLIAIFVSIIGAAVILGASNADAGSPHAAKVRLADVTITMHFTQQAPPGTTSGAHDISGLYYDPAFNEIPTSSTDLGIIGDVYASAFPPQPCDSVSEFPFLAYYSNYPGPPYQAALLAPGSSSVYASANFTDLAWGAVSFSVGQSIDSTGSPNGLSYSSSVIALTSHPETETATLMTVACG